MGLDLKLEGFPVPAKVNAGELMPVDINVTVVIIGPLGLQKQQAPLKNYDLTFQLIDNIEEPKQGMFI